MLSLEQLPAPTAMYSALEPLAHPQIMDLFLIAVFPSEHDTQVHQDVTTTYH